MQRHAIGIVVLVVSVVLGAYAAKAQLNNNILDQPRPDFDALGIHWGSFFIFPSLEAYADYDDSIFASDLIKVDDFYFGLEPRILVKSDWSNHSLEIDGYVRPTWYAEESSEDTFEWGTGINGSLDVRRSTVILGLARYDELAEDRSSIDAPGVAAEPVEYTTWSAVGDIRHNFNRFSVALGYRHTSLDYDDVARIGGGTIDQDFRDREIGIIYGEAGYDFSPGYRFIVVGEYGRTNYELEPGDIDFDPVLDVDRDSEGYKIEGGLEFEITRLFTAEVRAGYIQEDFDSLALRDIDGLSYGADVLWNVTRLTSLTFTADRRVEPSTSVTVGGRLTTEFAVGVGHELLRNLLIMADGGYLKHDFEGNGRKDDVIRVSAGLKYLMNNKIHMDLGYRYTSRDSNISIFDYDRNLLEFKLRLQI